VADDEYTRPYSGQTTYGERDRSTGVYNIPDDPEGREAVYQMGGEDHGRFIGVRGGEGAGDFYLMGEKFGANELGQMSPFEREYLAGLQARASGNVDTLAQQQMRRNLAQLSGGQMGIARALGARDAAGALRAGRERGEQVTALGNEAMAGLREMEKQQAADSLRGQILARLSGERQLQMQQQAASAGRGWGMAQSALGGLAAIAAAFISDERVKSKKSPKKGEKAISEMLSKMKPVNYDMAGKNETGILAQDLEKSEAGKEMIRRGPAGLKTIDSGAALKKMMAGMAMLKKENETLSERLAKIEGKKRGK